MLEKRTLIIIGGSVTALLLIGGIVYLRYQASEGLDMGDGAIVVSRSTNAPEAASSTEELPQAPDRDQDGLSDEAEKTLGTDPSKPDTDGDGVSDRDEVNLTQTDPKKQDQDKVSARPRRPRPSESAAASSTEPTPGTQSPETPAVGAQVDQDGDGLVDTEEARYGTDTNKQDTDDDGLKDGEEVYTYKTDPKLKDTDSDGYLDGSEVKKGYNPRGAGTCENAACTP